jgi:hypothetical protein
MKYLFLVIFLLIKTPIGLAQDQIKYARIQTNLLQNFDISHPRINLGIEKDFNNRQSISFGFAFYYHNLYYDQKTNGFGFNGEFKKFKNEKFYYSFNLNGAKIKYDAESQFFYGSADTATSTYFEEYRIEKILSEIYFKIGIRKDISKCFYYDTYCGLGFRYKEATHLDRSRPEDQFYRRTLRLLDLRDKQGLLFLPVLKVGLILGLKI